MSLENLHGQRWPDCDVAVQQRIKSVVDTVRACSANAYVGTYLQGSLAMGSYFPPKSDIDLLVVVSRSLRPHEREHFARSLAAAENSSTLMGGIELSVITRDVATAPTRFPPYELHYVTEWHERIVNGDIDWSADQRDGDLPAHLMVTKRRGMAADGPPVDEVFGTVAWGDYVHAVLEDFDWIVQGKRIVTAPSYSVLNICRTLELLSGSSRCVLSKDEGARWALEYISEEYRPVIEQALSMYRSTTPATSKEFQINGQSWDRDALLEFQNFACSMVLDARAARNEHASPDVKSRAEG